MQSVDEKVLVDENADANRANDELEVEVASCNVSGEESVKEVTEEGGESDTPKCNLTIKESANDDLSTGDQPLIRNSTIEELKLKLEKKEILFRARQTPPTSPTTPTSPDNKNFGENQENMIPETRTPPILTQDGLIAPRKPINPVREDPGRQNLHRELLFNQKIGRNVLNQKSELQRALERHKDNLAKKQLDNHVAEKTPELEKVIADRARRLENPQKHESEEDKVINKEFLQARMKLKSTSDSK